MVDKPQIWTDGDILPALELNDNVLQPLSALDSVDNNTQTTLSSTDVTERTLAINADQISNFVVIGGDLMAEISAPGSGVNSIISELSIFVDSVEQFRISQTQENHVNSAVDDLRATRVWVFKYDPTSLEKTSGFTIDLKLKRTHSGFGSSSTSNNYWEIWGN